jgi:hypothetical protein
MVSARDVIAKFSLERVKRFPEIDDIVANFQQLGQASYAVRAIRDEAFYHELIEYALNNWEHFEESYLPDGYKTSLHPNIKSFCNCLKGVIYYTLDTEGA